MTKNNRSIAEKTAELNELVAWFDSDEFQLEAALNRFEEARRLSDEITKDLDELKNEVEIVRQNFDGQQAK